MNFDILDFSKLFSDVHSPISLSLKCHSQNVSSSETNRNIDENTDTVFEKARKWDETLKTEFVNNLDINNVYNLETQLNNFVGDNITQTEIDSSV